MTTTREWLTHCAALLSGGPSHPPCAAGHPYHATTGVHVTGAHPMHDWPQLSGVDFTMAVFDAFAYRDTAGFCPADSDVARTLLTVGVWEGWESALALDVLRSGPGIVVDFGANQGWYSLLAVTTGHDVLAVEAEPDTARVLAANLAGKATIARGWVDADTPILPAGPRIRLAKADVEGAEVHCVTTLAESLEAGLVDYLLVEMTPAFGLCAVESTRAMLEGYGYDGFEVWDKLDVGDMAAFTADPLACTLTRPWHEIGPQQVNVLWRSPHLH